jgi:valyl-tRNA synthetase
LTRADRWILERLNSAVAACNTALGPARPAAATWPESERNAGLRLNEYTEAARGFVWNDLADWYLESVKARLATPGDDREVARAVLIRVFDDALRLLQPIVPFVTDELWQRLPGRADREFLSVAAWPAARVVPAGASEFEIVRDAVSAIRQMRGDYNIPPAKVLRAIVVPSQSSRELFATEAATIGRLTRCEIEIAAAAPAETAAHHLLADQSEVIIPLAGAIDLEKECARLRGDLSQLEKQLDALRARLTNENFIARAKPEVVDAERRKEAEWSARREQLSAKVASLCGG